MMPDFETCFRKLFPSLCVFVFQFLKDEKLSEDIVQDAFVELWNRYECFDQFYKVKAFLYISVRNAAINVLNQAKTSEKYSLRNTPEKGLSDAAFELAIIENERDRLLYQAIDLLPPQTKKIIRLSLEDMTNIEIADVLGISINTVKTLKKRAYKLLREELGDHYFY